MACVGIGVDIEDISRFKDRPYIENKDFYEKIFTSKEIEYCLKKQNPYPHFTARFCAKEAFIKASPNKITDYQKIEINNINNKPTITQDAFTIFVSMAHEKNKAIAFVIIEK